MILELNQKSDTDYQSTLYWRVYFACELFRGAPPEMETAPRRRSSMPLRGDTLSMLPEYADSEGSADIPRV